LSFAATDREAFQQAKARTGARGLNAKERTVP
jgi:hypothetical protein